MVAQKNKKIQLKKRSRQSARIHRGFAMPVGPGSENSLVSFRDFADLKAKYFRFTGRIQRRPFLARTLILMVAQFMFSLILYSKIIESILIGHEDYAIIFGLIFLVLTVPTVWAHISLGTRRFHDLNKPGALFAIPYMAYLASYILPVLALDTAALAAQSIMAVCYLGLATVKGTDGDNDYGPERAR